MRGWSARAHRWYGIPMFEVELLRALLIWPGATPAAGELTLVLADRLAPPTPGGYRLRCWAPPANALLEGATPRLDMLLWWRLFTWFAPFPFARTLTD